MWAITAGLLVVCAIIQIHPPLMWLGGNPFAWRLVSTAVLLGLIGWFWVCRCKGDTNGPGWQWVIFIVGIASFVAFAMGGFVRERSKSPDTVYGEIVKPEWTDKEADRYLIYEKWLRPRSEIPADLDRNRPEDWRQHVEQARMDGLALTDNEAERIIKYLEVHHQ
jgi:hypothetical protein